MRTILAACAVLLLAGCVTEQPANEIQAKKLGETCQTYGFKPGTDTFSACVFQLDQQRIANARQRRMAVGMALSEAGSDMQQANRTMNCTSTGYGNTVRTSCY